MHLDPFLRPWLIWMAFNCPWNSWLITVFFRWRWMINRMVECLDERTNSIQMSEVFASNWSLHSQRMSKKNSPLQILYSAIAKWKLTNFTFTSVHHDHICAAPVSWMQFSWKICEINDLIRISANQIILVCLLVIFFLPQFIAWTQLVLTKSLLSVCTV